MFNGYKTYLAAFLLAVVGVVEGMLGIDIPGVQVDDNWFTILIGALGLGGIRHAIDKANK